MLQRKWCKVCVGVMLADWAFSKGNGGVSSKFHRGGRAHHAVNWELLLYSIFQDFWTGGCTFRPPSGLISLSEKHEAGVAVVWGWWQSDKVKNLCSQMTLSNSQRQLCWAFGEVGASGLQTSKWRKFFLLGWSRESKVCPARAGEEGSLSPSDNDR